MKTEDLLAHKAQLKAKLEAMEAEKNQLVRKLKAIEILLEGEATPEPALRLGQRNPKGNQELAVSGVARKRSVPAHAVRISPRSSLIGAVQEVAMKQPGAFDSVHLLKALQSAYPEFHLTETKHISSPLSDLVKKGVLALESKRTGSKPNIYRAIQKH